ncbi:MAG: phytoene/squalene synthase family protein [Terriglobales bacterium]
MPTTAPALNPIQLEHAYAVCRGIARRAAKNFYFSFLVLPEEKRNAICAVYAFMRHADDITDDRSIPDDERRQRLAAWLAEAQTYFAGNVCDDPVLYALADAQHRFNIPADLFEQLVAGTAMDLDPGSYSRFATFNDLYRYCYYVASVVGLVCIHIFGYRDSKAEALAERLGIAFQLTNIIRDVKEDSSLGRVYIPQEDLARFGVSNTNAPSSPDDSKKWQTLLGFQADRAREYYAAATDLLPLMDADSRPALWALVTIYRSLLEKIAANDFDVFTKRTRLTFWEKMSVLAKAWYARIFVRPLTV